MHRGRLLASRLLPPDGEPPRLANYLTPSAKQQVLAAVEEGKAARAMLMTPRLWVDLLSSQPLCFNAMGDMAGNLALAARVLGSLWPELVSDVHSVRFEYSPGRGDPAYTGNRSAFDIYVEASGSAGRGFFGIEAKYHEDLRNSLAVDRGYAQMATEAGVFRHEAVPRLVARPLQQLMLDHLLALRLRQVEKWDWCRFVLLYPAANTACASAALAYADCLSDPATFLPLHLDRYFDALVAETEDDWAESVRQRYLGDARAAGTTLG